MVKAKFVPKIDIVGLVLLVALLDGREPLFLKIIQVFIWCRLRQVWCGDMLFKLVETLKFSHVFCSSSGSQVGFHETSKSSFSEMDTAFLFIFGSD